LHSWRTGIADKLDVIMVARYAKAMIMGASYAK